MKERKERQVRGKERRSKESEQKERERKQKRGRRRYGKYGNTLVPAGKGWLYQGYQWRCQYPYSTVSHCQVSQASDRRLALLFQRQRPIQARRVWSTENAHFFSSILFYSIIIMFFQGICYHGSQRPLPSHGIRTVLYSSSQSNIGPHKWAATA